MSSFERPHGIVFEDIGSNPALGLEVPKGLALVRANSLAILDRSGIGASTYEHTVDVFKHARAMAEILFERGHIIETVIDWAAIEDGAIRHDVGKSGMDHILDSKEVLTPETRQVVRTHPFQGLLMTSMSPDMDLYGHPDMDLSFEALRFLEGMQRYIVVAHHDYYTPGELADIAAHPVYGFDPKLIKDEKARALLNFSKVADIGSALTGERPYLKARLASEGRPTTFRGIDEVMSIIHETIPDLDDQTSAVAEEVIGETLEFNQGRVMMRELMEQLEQQSDESGVLKAFSKAVGKRRQAIREALAMPNEQLAVGVR